MALMEELEMNMFPYMVDRKLQGLRFRISRRLPERQPTEVWSGIDTVRVELAPFAGRFGNVKRYELMVLCAAVKHLQARNIFEFGTFDGLTTWHLAANAGAESRVWSLDLPLDHPARFRTGPGYDRAVGKIGGVTNGGFFHGTREAERIQQVYGDSLEFDPEPYRGQVDFCFIDAGHGYEHVSRDTANALLMVRPGGTIFWHDYSRWWPGVQRCLDELSQQLPVFFVADTALGALQMPESAK